MTKVNIGSCHLFVKTSYNLPEKFNAKADM